MSTLSIDNLINELPGDNIILALGDELTNRFREYNKQASENRIKIALLASKVKVKHTNQSNKFETGKKTPFYSWFESNNLNRVFGSTSNFSKYASVGDLLIKHKKILGRDVGQLPQTITALYAISQMNDNEIELCLEDHFTRKNNSISEKKDYDRKYKKPQPVINPHATEASINKWRKDWYNPPIKSTDTRKLSFITIKADSTIFDFNKDDGRHKGKLSIDVLNDIHEKIKTAVDKIVKEHINVLLVEDNLPKIQERYEKAKASAEKSAAAPKKKTSRSKK